MDIINCGMTKTIVKQLFHAGFLGEPLMDRSFVVFGNNYYLEQNLIILRG